MRVSSATLKRAAQSPGGTPDLFSYPDVRRRTIITSRPPTCGFEAATPSGYRHLLRRPSPIAIGLFEVHAEKIPVRDWFKVERPVHRDDPTLSAAKIRILWYGEPSRPETSLAAVDDHDVCSALSCS